jgi:hypothetical protein
MAIEETAEAALEELDDEWINPTSTLAKLLAAWRKAMAASEEK